MSRQVLITGASSGIGAATALALAAQGDHVVLVARRVERLIHVAEQCAHAGGSATVFPADVARAADWAEEALSKLNPEGEWVLINNAGAANFGPLTGQSADGLAHELQINLIGPLQLTAAFARAAVERGGGQVINVLSIAADTVFPGASVYGAGKAGFRQAMRSLAAESRAQGLRVTNVLPGATDTEIWGEGGPDRSAMLTAEGVAETLVWLIQSPKDRTVEELRLTPPLGIL
jgi:short-subunit dehydrogenase